MFVSLAAAASAAGDLFAAALAGGATPRLTYLRLAEPDLSGRVKWADVNLFWGDERCLPADHPESNYRIARVSWLERAPIPAGNIHPIQGEMQPARAAEAYEAELRRFFGPGKNPEFDLIFLGLGEDGHTASLFPGDPALREPERWVTPVEHRLGPAPLVDRVTFTPSLINRARQVIFLVTGAAKAGIVARVLKGSYQPQALPAQLIRPHSGRLVWMLDAAAASGLEPMG